MGGQSLQLEAPVYNPDLNPFVGQIANRLLRSFAEGYQGNEQERWALITEVLGFAAQAEQQLSEQRQLISELQSLALSDPLTGAGNRRSLEDFLRRAIANANRHGETGVVAFLDLDNFKDMNDHWGHDVGDECLRHVARLLVSKTRTSDFVARPGGDEFVVVLTHCTAEDGMRRMHQLRHLIDETPLVISVGSITLRASLGTVPYGKGDTVDAVLRAADLAMYADKMTRKKRPYARNILKAV